jgi:ribosomal protein S27E
MTKRSIYRDFPIETCVKQAEERRAAVKGRMKIHQKWSCRHCGSRQTMAEPNTFFRSGQCEDCGNVTIIDKCNYLAVVQ